MFGPASEPEAAGIFNSDLNVSIKQVLPCTLNQYFGDTTETRGFISFQPYKIQPIHQLEFNTINSEFNTIIIVNSSKFENPITKIKILKNKIQYIRSNLSWMNIDTF